MPTPLRIAIEIGLTWFYIWAIAEVGKAALRVVRATYRLARTWLRHRLTPDGLPLVPAAIARRLGMPRRPCLITYRGIIISTRPRWLLCWPGRVFRGRLLSDQLAGVRLRSKFYGAAIVRLVTPPSRAALRAEYESYRHNTRTRH